ncbi:MAG: enterochelin esterase [Bdellovibrionaceae bacterium]|nr:enterochelin esterase [Bdellovibrionales bacterium]MCB9086339.1 enterochelin esterase [Pseudobdellovibrionaceae bacterium]
MATGAVSPNLDLLPLKEFKIKSLIVQSQVLKNNPWKDPTQRHHVLLMPKGEVPRVGYPLVVVLAGFTGNSPSYLSPKSFEDNFAQIVDKAVGTGGCPRACFLFVDGMTFWGGSQFINSRGMGNYEDHLIEEVLPFVFSEFRIAKDRVCVMGGSSGGYGALHLGSSYPKIFPWVAAVAPDCFFEQSLLPEIYTALPIIARYGGIREIAGLLREGRFHQRRESHSVLNAIAMGLCYSPHPKAKNQVLFPIDEKTGKVQLKVWQKWLEHDPLIFLKARKKNVVRLKGVFLDVGREDQFHLQWGARQLREILKKQNVSHHYSEYDGNHFDISTRRPQVWSWLMKQWK